MEGAAVSAGYTKVCSVGGSSDLKDIAGRDRCIVEVQGHSGSHGGNTTELPGESGGCGGLLQSIPGGVSV